MSGYRTHMLIGAVGGLGAYRIINFLVPSAFTFRLTATGATFIVPSLVVGLTSAIVSQYMAVWPDIDERGSYISNRASRYMWLWAALLALCFAVSITQSILLILLICLAGSLVGRLGVGIFLYILRAVSGGHRHLTHSLVLGATLFIGSVMLYIFGLTALALPAFVLAWGQALHLIGDVVTPGGVPLFYPVYTRDIHLLPYVIARHGELLIGCAAFAAGMLFLFLPW